MNALRYGSQQPAPGPSTPGEAPAANPSWWPQLVPLLFIFLIFYLLLLRPQRRQQKEREAMLSSLKKDDHVLTSGGIYGIVVNFKDDRVVLRIDERNDVRIEVRRDAIAGLVKASGTERPASEQARK